MTSHTNLSSDVNALTKRARIQLLVFFLIQALLTPLLTFLLTYDKEITRNGQYESWKVYSLLTPISPILYLVISIVTAVILFYRTPLIIEMAINRSNVKGQVMKHLALLWALPISLVVVVTLPQDKLSPHLIGIFVTLLNTSVLGLLAARSISKLVLSHQSNL